MTKRYDGRFLVVLALILSLLVAVRERVTVLQLIDTASELQEEVTRLGAHSVALVGQLNRTVPGSPFLIGQVVSGDLEMPLIGVPQDAVFYRISVDCPFSPINYPFLNELNEAGVLVVGFDLESTPTAVKEHSAGWDVSFPILVNPEGGALDLVPRYGTPTVVVFAGGRVEFVEFGGLDPQDQQMIRMLTNARETDARGAGA